MAFIDGIQRFESTLVARMRAAFEDAQRQHKLRQTYRRTYDELNTLTERELNDLGLSRSDIKRVAHEAVYEN